MEILSVSNEISQQAVRGRMSKGNLDESAEPMYMHAT
jgi:hypothetical protein